MARGSGVTAATGRRRRTAVVGRTGARYGPAADGAVTDEPAVPDQPADPESGPTGRRGRRFAALTDSDEPVDPADRATEKFAPVERPSSSLEPDELRWLVAPQPCALVRPYAWTGGRTHAGQHLAIEALVSTRPRSAAMTSWEHRAITELCTSPRSIAEVAALLPVPLGVARVLVGDLATAGAVTVHRTAGCEDSGPDLAFMARVLDGLRKL